MFFDVLKNKRNVNIDFSLQLTRIIFYSLQKNHSSITLNSNERKEK